MKAQELIEKTVKERHQSNFSVIAIGENGAWWHIHRKEELPLGYALALLIKNRIAILPTKGKERKE